jgi:predicted nucleic acid-binding protein
MLVVDASAVTDLLFRGRAGASVEQHIVEHRRELAAPTLFDLEVLNALRHAVRSERVPPDEAEDAVLDLLDLPIERYPHEGFLSRIWHLRNNFSPYDASYLALAENLIDGGAPLLTTDARFARAARKHTGVEVLLAA